MIQILTFLIDITALLVTVSILIGISLSYAKTNKHGWVLFSFYALGIIGGIVEFFYAQSDPKGTNIAMIALNRQIIVGIFAVLCLSLLCAIVTAILRRHKSWLNILQMVLLGLAAGLILLNIVPQICKTATTFVFYGESGFGTLALMRLIGYLLAILACFLLLLSAYQMAKSHGEAKSNGILLLYSILIWPDYFVRAISALQRLKILDTKASLLGVSVFDIMIFEDHHGLWLVYAQVAFVILLAVLAYLRHRRTRGSFDTPAQRRLAKAGHRRVKRWAVTALIFALYVPFTLSFLQYQNTKPPEAVSMDSYQVAESKVIIDTETLADGKLHKYSYLTPNNVDVTFLAVKKPAGSYGVGLDACEICGTAGYFERGEDVICARCDVVMNKNTIGFRGGCNPIPLRYTIAEGKIYIELSDLQEMEKKFR